MRSTADWFRILKYCGVREGTAGVWAPVWERVLATKTFSQGDRDLADFLPTVLWESTFLTRLKESGFYTATRIRELGLASDPGSRWRSLVPRAAELAGSEFRFFEAVYGGRLGNGPEGSGDGAAYAGAGLMQATGKTNHQYLADRGGQDIGMIRQLLLQPGYSLELSIDWWEGRIPDHILGNDRQIRKVVNGGHFGLAEVESIAAKAQQALLIK